MSTPESSRLDDLEKRLCCLENWVKGVSHYLKAIWVTLFGGRPPAALP